MSSNDSKIYDICPVRFGNFEITILKLIFTYIFKKKSF